MLDLGGNAGGLVRGLRQTRGPDVAVALDIGRSSSKPLARALRDPGLIRRWASRVSTPPTSTSIKCRYQDHVIGGVFGLIMQSLNAMRPIVAARGIGLAEGALMYATEYVKNRPAFGKTIADFQGIRGRSPNARPRSRRLGC